MDNKKILVLVIAMILAFFTSLFFLKTNKKVESELDTINPVEETTLEKDSVAEENYIKDAVDDITEPLKNNVELIKKENTNLQIKSNIKLDDDIKEEEKSEVKEDVAEKVKEDIGIIKEAETDTIVITREFKVQSPAKYSFK